MSNFLNVVKKDDGISYYVLPKGSKIYRGDNQITLNYTFPNNRRTFFAFTSQEATEYGVVYEFETNKELYLVKIDDEDNLGKLHENASEDVKKIIENNYGYGYNRGKKRIRDSNHQQDYKFSDYLCSKGFQGYASDIVRGDIIRPDFHREIMLCDPQKHVFIKQKITPDEEEENLRNTTNQKNKAFDDKMKREEKQKEERKRNQISLSDSDSKMPKRLFDDDDDDDGDKKFSKNLFGDDDEDYGKPLSRKLFGGRKRTKKYKKSNKRKLSKSSSKKTKRRKQ